ncbi:hypothetical protein, partial [Streptomyces sp. NPDC002530]
GAPDVLLPENDAALTEIERLNEQGLRVLLLARSRSFRAVGVPGRPDQALRSIFVPAIDVAGAAPYFDPASAF